MSTSVTAYFTNTASTTLSSTAWQASVTHGTDNTNVTQDYSLVGTSTAWGQVVGKGTASAWAAAGSIGASDANGFILESAVLNLAGNDIVAGSYSASVRLCVGHTDGTVVGTLSGCTITLRMGKRSSGGTYTQIMDYTLTGQSISVLASYTLSATLGANVSIVSGDLIVWNCWVNAVTNSNADAACNIRLNRISTNSTGDSNFSATFSYQATAGGTPNTKDFSARYRLLATANKDFSGRFRSVVVKDFTGRFRSKATVNKDFSGRFRSIGASTPAAKDFSARYILADPTNQMQYADLVFQRARLLASTSAHNIQYIALVVYLPAQTSGTIYGELDVVANGATAAQASVLNSIADVSAWIVANP